MQRAIYNDALRRSRKTIFDLDGSAEPTPPPKTKAKAPAKKTRSNARQKDKVFLENSTNVLMDLRKAASHPMLFRRLFTDDNLTSIAKLLLKEPDFKKRGAVFQYVKEDMEVMTDSELQVFCATYKVRFFLQSYMRIWLKNYVVHPSVSPEGRLFPPGGQSQSAVATSP